MIIEDSFLGPRLFLPPDFLAEQLDDALRYVEEDRIHRFEPRERAYILWTWMNLVGSLESLDEVKALTRAFKKSRIPVEELSAEPIGALYHAETERRENFLRAIGGDFNGC